MAELWIKALGLAHEVLKFFNRVLDFFKRKIAVSEGKELERAEIAKYQEQLTRETSEIITEERSKEETKKRLEDGSF